MPKAKSPKRIPLFKLEVDERKFWNQHDSTEYLDWSKAKQAILPNLKPSTKTISLRLPESMLDQLKVSAHKNGVPYQSYIKQILAQNL